jgi:hypothetical protein
MNSSQEIATLEYKGRSQGERFPDIATRPRVSISYSLAAALAIIAVISLLRLPWVLFPHELNVDESQMLAQGMKFLVDPVPWRSVDGTSGGPLNSYLISFFLWLGIKPGYVFAHLLANALVCLQLLTAHQTILRLSLGSKKIAACGILPMVLFYGFTTQADYLHYSSELLPALLLALAFLFFVVWLDEHRDAGRASRSLLLFLTGLAVGAAAFCKLQALPIAAEMGIGVLAASLSDRRFSAKLSHRVTQSTTLCAGALLPAGAILGPVARAGALRDFWFSYILGNLAYAGPPNWTRTLAHLDWLAAPVGLVPLVLTGVLAVALFVYSRSKSNTLGLSWKERWLFGNLLLYGGAALFAVSRPSTFFPHYTTLALHPITYLGTALLPGMAPLLDFKRHTRLKIAYALVSTVVVLIVAARIFSGISAAKASIGGGQSEPDSNDRIAGVIENLKNSRRVSSIAIWGWEPGVYVLTGIPPATRDAIGHFVISRGPLQGYFRKRFVNDLRSKMPDLFIDAVAPGAFMWYWSQNDGYESDGELKDFVDKNYVEVAELSFMKVNASSKAPAKPVRFFARRGLQGLGARNPTTFIHPLP